MTNHDDRRETLRQELLEFHFDCHPDPETIAERLQTDAELAALYEEVKQTAALLSAAASAEAPPLELSPPADGGRPAATKPVRAPRAPRSFGFRQVWYAAAGLFAIAFVPAIGVYLQRDHEVQELERGKVRLLLSAPPAVPDGSPLRFHVETLDLAQRPAAARIAWQVLDAGGTVLSESTAACDGSTDITVAGTLNKPRKLVVTATAPRSGFQKTLELPIHPSKSAPLVHITADKPAYRPGETAMLRIACLDRLTLRGADRIGLRCRIVDPKDNPVQNQVLTVGKGVTAWTWQIPPSAIGGNYALEVRDAEDKFSLERHEFLVRNFQPPKLQKKIVLDKQTYAAGERGAAELQVLRAGGGAAAGAAVHATLVVDGDEAWKGEARLDAEGRAVVAFEVPGNVRKGAARFVARITDGGNVETGIEPFVIPTEAVEAQLYPEGGELIAGAPNRVYAQLKDALDRPLSGSGRVVDQEDREVARFATEHMGRARFEFTPVLGRRYRVLLESPRKKSFDLPAVHDTGVVLRPAGEFFAAGEPAKVKVFTAGRGPWIACVFCRGVLVGQQSILQRGASEVAIPLVDEASGVVRVTVFDHEMRPVAERLVQRDGRRSLSVTLSAEHPRLAPGSKQKVRVKAVDETGEPVSGIVGLTVVDRAVADMLDYTRVGLDDQRHLFTDVEKPDDRVEELLPGAAQRRRNVDLLLGSLGWRRYLWRGETEEKALLAAGGEWARALPVREGRSAAPLVTDTLGSHQVELQEVRGSRAKAWGMLSGFAGWGLVGFVLLALVHGLFWIGRRLRMPTPVFVGSSLAGLTALFLALVALNQSVMRSLGVDSMAPGFEVAETAVGSAPTGFELDDLAGANRFLPLPRFAGVAVDIPETTISNLSTWGYVRDFDVQVAQGARILDGVVDLPYAGDAGGLVADFYGRVDRGVFLPPTQWSYGLGDVQGNADNFFGSRVIRPAPNPMGFFYKNTNYMVAPVPDPDQVLVTLVDMERIRARWQDLSDVGAAGEQAARIAQLGTEFGQKNAQLDQVYRYFPAIFSTLYPQVTGKITRVGAKGKLVTILLTSGAEHLKPGMRLAIYGSESGYKAEATVSEIDDGRKFCFARIGLQVGPAVTAGDSTGINLATAPGLVTNSGGTFAISETVRRRLETVLGNPALAGVRYGYKHTAADSRQRFVETLFWQPYLVTDEKGEASVEFDVSDSVTTWSVFADAHGGGRVGQGTTTFASALPFSLDPKAPTQVSEGDRLQVPIGIVADDPAVTEATLELVASGPVELRQAGSRVVRLVKGRGRALAEITVGTPEGQGAVASLAIRGQVQGASDQVERRFVVRSRGFPHAVSHAGELGEPRELRLSLPDELARRTGSWTLRFYPSPLANLEEAVQGMLREPSGCFEQVSSSNYPNVMILSLLQTSGDNVPALARKAQDLLAKGYEKLAGYEVTGGGFEWWGKDPAHAALTAYGLMQFTDMARVYDRVDPEMVARTRAWLLGKRDGNGGFVTGGGRYGHFMGGSAEARSAYIAYALLYAGETPAKMQREIDFLEQRGASTDNAYELAVIACALGQAGRPAAEAARQRLAKLQSADGSLLGTGSITGSGERDLRIETTGFAVLAWLGAERHDDQVVKAVQFLQDSRQGGGHFGGTQATVMALKALTGYLNANVRSVEPGFIKVHVGDKEIASRELFGSEKRTITLEHLERHLVVGNNKVRIELTGGNRFPFGSELTYRADTPLTAPDCKLDLGTYLTKPILEEGTTTALHAVIKNKTNAPVANPMVLLGLPAGLHVDSKVLDDLKNSDTIAAWELTDDTIVLYLRGLQANEARDITIDVTGRIPGTSKGPASRSYLYYDAGIKVWTPPIQVTVTPL